jgi:hypothetical protein
MNSNTTRKFCVLTVGRAGSTSLMNYLEKFDDIAVPGKNIDCPDNELVHPHQVANYMKQYSQLCCTPLVGQNALIDGFFQHNANYRYAGFKSMPNRHPDIGTFTHRNDVRFITLIREDIASTAASFLVAMATGSWRRYGEPQPTKWTFCRMQHERPLLGNLAYIHHSHALLASIPRSIALTYEELCRPDFSHAQLDEFFARPIRMENPRGPTTGQSYVENWEEFSAYVAAAVQRLAARKL